MSVKKRTKLLVWAIIFVLVVAGLVGLVVLRPWHRFLPTPLTVKGFAGTSQVAIAHINAPAKINKATFHLTGALAGMVTSTLARDITIDGGDVAVPLTVIIPADKQVGSYAGTLELHDSSKTIASAPITVAVQKATSDTVPADFSYPTLDRMITPDGGLPMVKDELLVGLNLNTLDPDARIKEIAKQLQGAIVGALTDTKTYQLRFDVKSLDELAKKRNDLSWTIGVSFASYDVQADTETTPNDTGFFDPKKLYENPWLAENNNLRTWGQRYIGLPQAWDKTTGSSSVRVGLVDTGFDFTHPDLVHNIAPGAGFGDGIIKYAISQTKIPHATYVGGTMCAEGDNKIGIAGVMWHCSLGFYDDSRYWPFGALTTSVIKAMHLAIQQNMRVVNMSIGWETGKNNCNGQPLTQQARYEVNDANEAVRQEIEWGKQEKKDVLWVFAAGNACRDASEVAPAALARKFADNTIAVAAIARSQNMQSDDIAHLIKESNYGDIVSVAAPGSNIYTTSGKATFAAPTAENYYDFGSGTSLSAPFVSGLAGLVLSAHPDFTVKQVKQCIVDAADNFGHAVLEHDFRVIDAPHTLDCQPPKDPDSPAGSAQPCVFSFARLPEKCESTNPTVTVRFTNVAGSEDCKFESELGWDEGANKQPQIDTIAGLAVDRWKPLGTHTYNKPGRYLIGHVVRTSTSGPCTILPSLYEFTLLPK